MITAHEVETAGFRRAGAGAIGYDEDAVDDFLDRVVETLRAIERGGECPAEMLSARDVVDVIFAERDAHISGGYDLDDVDDLLDRVARRIHRYEEGLRHAAGQAPAQHVADGGESIHDGATPGAGTTGDSVPAADAGRDAAPSGAQTAHGGDVTSSEARDATPRGADDDHLVMPPAQVHAGRGEAETPAVADLDRQDGRTDAGMSAGAGADAAGSAAVAAASVGAVSAAAVEQKRISASRYEDDRRDLKAAEAQRQAAGSGEAAGRGYIAGSSDSADVADVAGESSAREEAPASEQGAASAVSAQRVVPAAPRQQGESAAAASGSAGQVDDRRDDVRPDAIRPVGVRGEGVERDAREDASSKRPEPAAWAMTQENVTAREDREENTPQPETARQQNTAPEFEGSLQGINMVGARPLAEVGEGEPDRARDTDRPSSKHGTAHETPARQEGSVSGTGAAGADPRPGASQDDVSPEKRFDAERRDGEGAAPAAGVSAARVSTAGALAPEATPNASTPNEVQANDASERVSTKGEPDDRQVNDQEARVVVTRSGGTPSVTPLEPEDSRDEKGEQVESFTSVSAGTFAEPGVREPADTPETPYTRDTASAPAEAAGPGTAGSSSRGLTILPTEARLAADPSVTGERSRRLHDAWRAAVPASDEEGTGIISYPATDHRVPLPRGEARRKVSERDREAESQFHPEYSSYASPETPMASEPQGVELQEAPEPHDGTGKERGRVRVIGRAGERGGDRGAEGASEAPDPQRALAAEAEGGRIETAQDSPLRPVEPSGHSEACVADDIDAQTRADAEGDVAGNIGAEGEADAEAPRMRVQARGSMPSAQESEFDSFAARSAVADEPLTPTVETPSAMRSLVGDEAHVPAKPLTRGESPEPVAPPAAPAASAPGVLSSVPTDDAASDGVVSGEVAPQAAGSADDTGTEAPVVKESAPVTTEDGDELQYVRRDDERAEPTPHAEPIERPEGIAAPQGIDMMVRALPARDDKSRKGLLRRIFKG